MRRLIKRKEQLAKNKEQFQTELLFVLCLLRAASDLHEHDGKGDDGHRVRHGGDVGTAEADGKGEEHEAGQERDHIQKEFA